MSQALTCWCVKIHFRCILNPGAYFLNAGVLGIINGSEEYLDRNIDIAMFRVQDNENFTSTAIVDFIEHADVAMVEKVPKTKAAEACGYVQKSGNPNIC